MQGTTHQKKNKMKKKQCAMWVDPAFKKKVKAKAAMKGISIIDLTKELALDEFDDYFINKKKKEKGGKFDLHF